MLTPSRIGSLRSGLQCTAPGDGALPWRLRVLPRARTVTAAQIAPGGVAMKDFHCRDAGMSCDFVARGNSNQEILDQVGQHAQSEHHLQDSSGVTCKWCSDWACWPTW